ncbi:hypothetical protein AQUCO_02000271v1 [Aquilegia coerulea]|uniref:DUF674 domain-containing protein n=1 Tax=Aquilegia coerulea TaxID=218851 RepID=A0A2G5DGU8_AQUCA|nr:hypothetical protein AQUCO_02000271v1 [Aquilegia coerulea]
MGDTDKISLKLLVDKENNKVLFAEAGTYFVKVLLSFLSYPIGASVDALDMQYFQTEACKDMLVRPTWACSTSTKIHYHYKIHGEQNCCGVKHKITPVDESEIFMITDDLHVKKVSMETGVQILSQMGITDVSVVEEKIISVTEVEVVWTTYTKARKKLCNEYPEQFTKDKKIPFNPKSEGGYVKATTIFMVTDELTVEPFSLVSSISFINKLDVPLSDLEERIATFGEQEVMDLLRRSLLSKKPITDIFLKPRGIIKYTRKRMKTEPLDKQFLALEQTVLRDSIEKISLKLLVRKSQNKVLYAVANAEFVDLIFSVLTFPWETMIELFCGCSYIGSMDNLYKSEEKLCNEYPGQFTKDEKKPFNPKCCGGFVKPTTVFMVTDELTVEPFSLVSSISFINRLDVPLSDLEERLATVGEQEALSIVKASLTTTTPLTNVFCKKN